MLATDQPCPCTLHPKTSCKITRLQCRFSWAYL